MKLQQERMRKMNGRNKEKQEIAKNMMRKNLDINLIQEITGLSKEEIEKLEI